MQQYTRTCTTALQCTTIELTKADRVGATADQAPHPEHVLTHNAYDLHSAMHSKCALCLTEDTGHAPTYPSPSMTSSLPDIVNLQHSMGNIITDIVTSSSANLGIKYMESKVCYSTLTIKSMTCHCRSGSTPCECRVNEVRQWPQD